MLYYFEGMNDTEIAELFNTSRSTTVSYTHLVEQNDNNFDGIINNTSTVDELEAKVKAGETISLVDLANAVKADQNH